jgi:uncharacterized membrane protein YagU involved in acid resistance
MNRILFGAIAGLVATVPMTIAMKLMHRQLPADEQYPLPPRLIVERVTEETGVEDELGEDTETGLAYIGHFSYGTTVGAIYPLLFQQPNAANGVVYGLIVWSGSYLGYLPALGILTPATDHPARRNALMIAAHVVWGAALGALAGQMIHSEKAE